MNIRSWRRTGGVAALCVAVGALGGIAGSAAAPSSSKKKSKSTQAQKKKQQRRGPTGPTGPRGPHRGGPRMGGPGGPGVHAEIVTLNRAGTKFITVTIDNGTAEKVEGQELTIKQAIGNVTYKTVALTIPADAKVFRNGAEAKLGDIKANDHVHVMSSEDGTTVLAGDGSMRPHRGPGGPGGPGGHRGRGPHHGPPPGAGPGRGGGYPGGGGGQYPSDPGSGSGGPSTS